MIKRYKLPIQGTVLKREPLKGADADPVSVIDLTQLSGRPRWADGREQGYAIVCLAYDIDEEWCEVELEASEEFHNWLAGILPQLRGIQKERDWKLDKSKMVENLKKK